MNHGLSATVVAAINRVLARCPEVERAVLYGSRAKGNFKPGSDIDLTLFARLAHAPLREHIERAGILFYEKPPVTTGEKQ